MIKTLFTNNLLVFETAFLPKGLIGAIAALLFHHLLVYDKSRSMSLYFDTKVEFLDSDAVSTIGSWHPNEPLFAVASYSQERGGSITVFTDNGEPQRDVTYPVHSASQVSALAWHPEKVLLSTGWENGEIHVWFSGHREFASVNGPHKAPIVLLEFSEQGGRMVTADAAGLLTGWRYDGQYQFLTMFSHDLRDVLLHITFRKTIESEVREEMVNLAKAAVAGDESALDTLTNWRPRTAARSLTHSGVKDNHCFYVGTKTGHFYYINQGGACTEVLKSNSTPVMQMLWHPKKDAVICLMEDMTVALYLVESTGILTELERVKLSNKTSSRFGAICWAGCSLAIITGDFCVRLWDIEKSDNYLLNMELPSSVILNSNNTAKLERLATAASTNHFGQEGDNHLGITHSRKVTKLSQPLNEVFTCLAYSCSIQTLCAGTNLGNIYTWKHTASYLSSTPEDSWQLTNISTVRGAIKQCFWGVNELAKSCMLVNCISNVYILKEQPLLFYFTRDLWAVQRNVKLVFMQHSSGKSIPIQTEFAVTALTLNDVNMVVSNGRCISTYCISKIPKSTDFSSENNDSLSTGDETKNNDRDMSLEVRLMQTFNGECLSLFIFNQNIFCLTSNDITIYSIGGVVLNRIKPNENEGKIIGMDLSSNFLTFFTMNGYLKAYDVSRHDPKLLFPGKSGYDLFNDFGEVIMAKCNNSGTHLAIIIANRNFQPKSVVYCWNFERNQLMEFDMATDENEAKLSGLPVNFYWDTDEYRLLAVELKSVQKKEQQMKTTNTKSRSSETTQPTERILPANHFIASQVLVMFLSDKQKLGILENRVLGKGEKLINLCVPNIITLDINVVKSETLQDFADLKDCDAQTRKMVFNFSLHLAEGNMDMAYRCIRSVQSKAIWLNLAKMCVQTNRLDVAKVCMGHLQKARSVRAIRKAIENDDLEEEAKVAVLAIELGMIDKAKELYRACGRMDLLNKLMQSCGQLDEAIAVSENDDRVHLKNVYYQKAQLLREKGDIKGALEYFEKTQNPVQNITQMLLENPQEMKSYMQITTDSKVLKWWAQYIESSGDMDAALAVYQKANDWFSQIKILCYLGKISKADAIARQSGDQAACYHLARHYENVGKFQEAIMFYTRAQTFSNAIRICKENDLQDELWTVASSARSREKAIAAAYFEECGSFKRAVELYHRAGMLHKALEMAFESGQPEILEIIAADLTPDSDTELINRCADFFTSIDQHQKAVLLLARTKQLERSLRICVDKGVPITEDLVDMLTPAKGEYPEEIRISMLNQLGELLQQQGDYHLATKKFTQAGDKVRAMKSLLKSGNTDKIIFFANMSRQREVYIMAANYLQALNWQDDPNVLKHIVTFYSKGQAYDSLANFYAVCAQIEIDEFHNYEKALKAMHEASKCLEKLGHAQHAFNNLQRTIEDVKKILNIQSALQSGDHQTAISGCRSMLVKPESPPIRQAHILAMLIRAYAFTKQYNEAGQALKELALRERSWSTMGLVEKSLAQKIAKECNLDFELLWNSNQGPQGHGTTSDNEEDEEIQEELQRFK